MANGNGGNLYVNVPFVLGIVAACLLIITGLALLGSGALPLDRLTKEHADSIIQTQAHHHEDLLRRIEANTELIHSYHPDERRRP